MCSEYEDLSIIYTVRERHLKKTIIAPERGAFQNFALAAMFGLEQSSTLKRVIKPTIKRIGERPTTIDLHFSHFWVRKGEIGLCLCLAPPFHFHPELSFHPYFCLSGAVLSLLSVYGPLIADGWSDADVCLCIEKTGWILSFPLHHSHRSHPILLIHYCRLTISLKVIKDRTRERREEIM